MADPASVYLAYNDAENRQDAEAAAALVAPDLKVEVNGRSAISSAEDDRAANAELLRRYPDYRRHVVDVMASGDRGVVRWRMLGTPAEPGVEPLDVHGCSVVTVREGRITQAFLYYDGAALDSVLGASS
jgi:ketosteroid isomerase-like protein